MFLMKFYKILGILSSGLGYF